MSEAFVSIARQTHKVVRFAGLVTFIIASFVLFTGGLVSAAL